MGGGGAIVEAVGVFGKLPARRDYVRHGVDPRLMRIVDPWLQDAVAESRRALGDAWLDHWLRAPIWRFWLGPRILGQPVLGALMPSVDGVGRYFPLCLLGVFDGVPPPERDEQAEWFAAAETLLLAALGEEGTYEALVTGLAALPAPRSAPPLAPALAADGARDWTGVPARFAMLRREAPDLPYDRCTCWWVPSPDDGCPPLALLRRGLPSPADYTSMVAPAGRDGFTPATGEGAGEAAENAFGEAP